MLLTYALQHLAAGILLCAIAQELVPTLSDAKTQVGGWSIPRFIHSFIMYAWTDSWAGWLPAHPLLH